MIARTLAETGELLDPHTAVGYGVARKATGLFGPHGDSGDRPSRPNSPMRSRRLAAIRPGLPQRLAPLMMAEERLSVLPNDPEAVKAFILERVRSLSWSRHERRNFAS